MSENIVTIRIRMGQYELEVKGPKTWADKQIEKFIARRKLESK